MHTLSGWNAKQFIVKCYRTICAVLMILSSIQQIFSASSIVIQNVVDFLYSRSRPHNYPELNILQRLFGY